MLAQKKDEMRESGILFRNVTDYITKHLKTMYPNGFSKEFYSELVSTNLDNESFTIFSSIPEEYKTEDMYMRSYQKNKQNPNLSFCLVYDLEQKLKKRTEFEEVRSGSQAEKKEFEKNEFNPKNFSKEFYKTIISLADSYYTASSIIKALPQEYQTEDMYMELIKKFKSYTFISDIFRLIPEHLKSDEFMKQMIDELKITQDDAGRMIGNKFSIMRDIIHEIPMELKNQEETIDKLASFQNEDGENIFILSNLLFLRNKIWGFQQNEYVDQKIIEILNTEFENAKNNLISSSQIQQYENEIIEMIGLNYSTEQKTTLYQLNALFLLIPSELISEDIMKEYKEIVNQSILQMRNGKNDKAINYISQLFENNDELFITLDRRFIESDKYIDLLGHEKFEILSLYPEIQNQIFNLNDTSLRVFSEMIDYAVSKNNDGSSEMEDWIPVADKILQGMNNKDFEEILKRVYEAEFENLSEEMKINLLKILSKQQNFFGITDFSQLENYESIKRETCIKILNTPTNENNISSVKMAILELFYNIDINEAKFLLDKFGYTITDIEGLDPLFADLSQIKKIIESDNLEVLCNFGKENYIAGNSKDLSNSDPSFREKFKKMYSETLYKVSEHEEDQNENFSAEYNGKKISVYRPTGSFNLIIHALGAYSGNKAKSNYKTDWNMPKMRYHGVCTSYIGNNSISTARISDVIYGFNDITDVPLLMSASWDIGSNYANKQFATSNQSVTQRFLTPSAQIDLTRHTHNEMVFNRRIFRKNIISQKMEPAYIVYIPDYLHKKSDEEVKQILALEDKDVFLKEYMQKDPLWGKTQKAAAEFGVPIVILDRVVYAEKELQKIEKDVEKFEKTLDPVLIENIICEFENNRTGNRDYHKEVCNNYFSANALDSYVARVIQAINRSDLPLYDKIEMFEELNSVLANEIEKRNDYRRTEDDDIMKQMEELYAISEKEKEKIVKSIQQISDRDESKEFERIVQKVRQQNGEIVSYIDIPINFFEEVQDMKTRNLYENKLLHSERHIQNVMLFSSILGKKLNFSDSEITLAIEAAKFHDSGRIGDREEEHGELGAKIAGNQLKRVYSAEDLKIIQIAIEYHNLRENVIGTLNERKLQELFEKYELAEDKYEIARKIAMVVKDADALDRTRFTARGALDVKFLHTDEAKSMVKFATDMNEEYSRRDVEDYIIVNPNVKEEIMEQKDRNNNWRQVIRSIRQGQYARKKSAIRTRNELAENAKSVDIQQKNETVQSLYRVYQRGKSRNISGSQLGIYIR